ncbi:D-alanyl-D-alanine carboxypeptidase family protein [Cellulomonas sp. DKR-3]|uniref:D-alanyl-D-alanine carboxypeptidase family protein n=1 Tax=Cellulomonas fulva TaxID=2835530 RepID=A0ABS5U219_9CELL|nr:D-alanyl-D-alanine carboxypeptidase family protein [Cellulomonas fulva]MBT0995444.1 D-alanyl-D-alanine carboxypeptidase family protein [Cellulomonas fulva]
MHTRPEAHTPDWVPGRRTVGQPPATPRIALPETAARPAEPRPAATPRRTVPDDVIVAAAHEMPRVPLASVPTTARVVHVVRPAADPSEQRATPPAAEATEPAVRAAATMALAAVAPAPSDEPAERATRSAERAPRTAAETPLVVRLRSHRKHGRNAARFGVVGALAAVTVAVPLSHGTFGGTEVLSGLPTDRGALPSTVSALTAQPAIGAPPASLAASKEVVVDERALARVSRDATRQTLPGCDPSARAAGLNGQLATEDLCTLWDGHTQMRADAASALAGLNAVYAARFGADMCVVSGYRTLAVQYTLKAQKGGLAATPGKSNHGWGLAVDLCSDMTSGDRWEWLNENAGIYGFENPAWAKEGGSGPYERWHWEYLKGVMADGEYYGES